MPKQKLFDEDSEEEVSLKTENEYAKKYDAWREKEEIHKLEQKYGPDALNSDAELSSDSEDESDEPPEVSEEMEEQFLKTLSLLKTKDPRIYDPSYKFFDEKEKDAVKETKQKTLTFADSDDDEDDGNIFSIEKKADVGDDSEVVKPSTSGTTSAKKGAKLKQFLTGKAEHIDDPVEKDLAPLKALWSDPNINEGEAFLRDYILNKRYLEEGEAGEAADKIRDDDDLEADEETVEQQGKFERAYNFRFEEPDQEYLKRFPRTMNFIRPKDDKRSKKRAELRTRKEEEKLRKMEEIGRLKALKLKEIQEKIARIKEVTGNEELAFKEDDIEGDFDPEEHDRRMKAIFDEQYYGEADDEKPVFPDLDTELEIENWDNYDPDNKPNYQDYEEDGEAHCEDDNFNMDADYDPKKVRANLVEEMKKTLGKKRRNRKKKSKLAKLLESDKPKFIPTEVDKTYAEYMEEYYKMDCEDVIGGDLPTRFKYREVVPNDYGLTVEEILLADDKELTQWVPLKKLVKHRPESVQKSEVNTYAQKAADVNLKKKVLPSLFKDLPEEPELVVPPSESKKKKKKKKKNKEQEELNVDNAEEIEPSNDVNSDQNGVADNVKRKKKKGQEGSTIDNSTEESNNNLEQSNDDVVENSDVNISKHKKKKHKELKDNSAELTEESNSHVEQTNDIVTENNDAKASKQKKKKNKQFKIEETQNETPSQVTEIKSSKKRKIDEETLVAEVPNKKKKNKVPQSNGGSNKGGKNKDFNKNKNKNNKFHKNKQNNANSNDNPFSKLSDERLKAYGLNPKKYKKFLQYKKF